MSPGRRPAALRNSSPHVPSALTSHLSSRNPVRAHRLAMPKWRATGQLAPEVGVRLTWWAHTAFPLGAAHSLLPREQQSYRIRAPPFSPASTLSISLTDPSPNTVPPGVRVSLYEWGEVGDNPLDTIRAPGCAQGDAEC